MWRNRWDMMKILSIGDPVSAMTMAWKVKYISGDQWEDLCGEFFSCCSLVWKHPVHTAAFLFCAPRLIKILVFFYPLVITTALFLLIIFSLGPQLERMKADRDLQLERFREAIDDDDGGGSWAGQQMYGNFAMAKGTKRSAACNEANWTDWVKRPHDCHQSVFYTKGRFGHDTEKKGLKVGFDTVAEEEVGRKEVWNVSSKSIILSKLGDLMEKLIAELGGRVELDALNALEAIAQVLIESTGRGYQKAVKTPSFFNLEAAENGLSDDGQFPKTDLVGGCPFGGRSDSVEGTNGETLEPVARENIESCTEQRGSVVPVSSVKDSCAAEISDISQGLEKGASLDGDRVYPPGPRDGAGSLSAQDKSESADGVFRNSRSFPPGTLDMDYGSMDKLWEMGEDCGQQFSVAGEEEDWKDTLADKFSEDQQVHWRTRPAGEFYEKQTQASGKFQGQLSSISLNVPEQENQQRYMTVGKLRNTPLEAITFVKKPQFLTSPVMLLEPEDMDLLWEEYNDAPSNEFHSMIEGNSVNLSENRGPADMDDFDAEEDSDIPQVCCLKALKFSKDRFPLKKPNFMKISKALKKLGLMQHFRGRKQRKS